MNRLLKILLIINTSIFIISLSIAFVILYRPLYYWNIDYLKIESTSGYKKIKIKEAYDDVMDYLIINKEFKTGSLKYTQDGMNHFRDCKKLFILDFVLLGISSIVLLVKLKFFNNIKVLNCNIGFWSSLLIIVGFVLLITTIFIIGFDKSFEFFHKIFFLGKTNWILDPDTDEIVKILPKQFFMNCGILISALVLIMCTINILRDVIRNNKTNNNTV